MTPDVWGRPNRPRRAAIRWARCQRLHWASGWLRVWGAGNIKGRSSRQRPRCERPLSISTSAIGDDAAAPTSHDMSVGDPQCPGVFCEYRAATPLTGLSCPAQNCCNLYSVLVLQRLSGDSTTAYFQAEFTGFSGLMNELQRYVAERPQLPSTCRRSMGRFLGGPNDAGIGHHEGITA
jgi:hypothetical protein